MPDVKMNYSSMEQMQRAFGAAHKQVDDSMREMKKLAQSMGDGALVGMGGDAFKTAIEQKLMKRMKVLSTKMAELEKDIKDAVSATRDGVKTARNRFTN
ncbi:MAG TPA: WXG100 family type VII secretion target [Anaerolineales bacterium]|nr:WXG100 family type VII secretion target [Anaerolineales bacterium]